MTTKIDICPECGVDRAKPASDQTEVCYCDVLEEDDLDAASELVDIPFLYTKHECE